MNYKYFFLSTPITLFLFLFTVSCKQDVKQTSESENVKDTTSTMIDTKSSKKTIIFFGNSLTAGYGLEEDESFPSLIQDRIDSLNLPYQVVNAGVSGETTADGKSRINWILKQPVDVFVLELGANDVLRGQELNQSEENLRAILQAVKDKYPDAKIVIAGMQAPSNMGNAYTKSFAAIYPNLAKEFDASLIPFLLEDVATIPTLNLPDGKHPNSEGQKIVRDNVWRVLEGVL